MKRISAAIYDDIRAVVKARLEEVRLASIHLQFIANENTDPEAMYHSPRALTAEE